MADENIKTITTDEGCIQNSQKASYVRCSMENKNLLSTAGSIYIGTGEYIKNNSDESIAYKTIGKDLIEAINERSKMKSLEVTNLLSNTIGNYTMNFSADMIYGGIKAAVGESSLALYDNSSENSNKFIALKAPNFVAEVDNSKFIMYHGTGSSAPTWELIADNTLGVINIEGSSVNLKVPGSSGTPIKIDLGSSLSETTIIGSVSINNSSGANVASITSTGAINGSSITSTGAINGSTFNATSDERLKTNIKEFEYHNSILDIPIREYNWKKSGEHAIGFVAQELQKSYPELVSENEDGYLSIKETKIVYLLLEEVKNLKKEIEEIKKGD